MPFRTPQSWLEFSSIFRLVWARSGRFRGIAGEIFCGGQKGHRDRGVWPRLPLRDERATYQKPVLGCSRANGRKRRRMRTIGEKDRISSERVVQALKITNSGVLLFSRTLSTRSAMRAPRPHEEPPMKRNGARAGRSLAGAIGKLMAKTRRQKPGFFWEKPFARRAGAS